MYKEMTDSWVQADLKYLSEKILLFSEILLVGRIFERGKQREN